jgi:hypothetical protein
MSSGSGPNPSRYPGWGPAAVSRSDWPGPGPGAAECRTRRPVASVSCPACAVSRDQRQEQGPDREPRPRRRATYNRNDGVRHLFAAYDLTRDRLFGHVKTRKKRTQFLEFCRYLRSLYPPDVRIAIVCDNYSPHLSTSASATGSRPTTWRSPIPRRTPRGSTASKRWLSAMWLLYAASCHWRPRGRGAGCHRRREVQATRILYVGHLR